MIRLPFAKAKHAPIAAEDQSRVIAAVLNDYESHVGNTYALYGPIEMDYFQIAETMSKVLGRTIIYEPIEIDEFRKILETAGANPVLIQHLCAVAVDYRNGVFSGRDGIIAKITGQAPMALEAFVTKYRTAFEH